MPLVGGQGGWALAHLEFGSSVNPITTRGADYAHHSTTCPPGFLTLGASLKGQLISKANCQAVNSSKK